MTRLRLRRAGIAVMLVVGVFATVATTPSQTTIRMPEQRGSVRLDAEHPAALARIVISVNPEGTSTGFYGGASLMVDTVRSGGTAGSGAGQLGAAESARFIVTSVSPGELPTLESSPPEIEPGPSPFQSEVRPGLSIPLPMTCGIGPCERAFVLIAELTDPEAGPIEVGWTVGGSLNFPGTTWPSGAGGTITLGAPALIAGPTPQLVVSTDPEPILLGPRQPAAARVIEVSVGPEAIPAAGEPIAVLSVELTRRQGSGGDFDRSPIVKTYPLADLAAAPEGPLPTGLQRDPDPFAGCEQGAACVRQFMVTVEWAGDTGEDEAYDFRATVRRLDLVGAWSQPAELTASVERRFDVAPDARTTEFHLEGHASGSGPNEPAEVRLDLHTSTTATDPIARLLPAPAVMTYRASVPGTAPVPSPVVDLLGMNMDLPGQADGMRRIYRRYGAGGTAVTTNPLAGCQVGDSCAELTVATFAIQKDLNAPIPTVPFEWRLDLTLFSFAEAPLTLSTIDHSPDVVP